MTDAYDVRPPWRQQFDSARDPYTARNVLGILGTGGGGGGNVSNSGTPTVGQYAKWLTATTIQGVAPATVLSDIGAQPAGSYGNVSNVGTPLNGQFAQWTGATTIQGITAAAAGAAIAPAWTAYTPTITAGTGTFTTVSATGRFLTIGKVTHIRIEITITTNGSAALYVLATLPNTAILTGGITILPGRERAVSGKMVSGSIGILSNATMSMVFYDNTYPGANGAIIDVSGSYENT